MKRVTFEFARHLIDFEPGRSQRNGDDSAGSGAGFGESQLEGTVAAFNMLADNRVAYVADEVGMGKTFVALGVLGLLRHLEPAARVVVIAPRENIQLKWIKELRNFVRSHWKVVDNRLKSIQGTPARRPTACHSLHELARELSIGDHRDLFLRMTSFSLATKQAESRRRYRKALLGELPWIDRRLLSSRNPEEFRDMYGRALNAAMPPIDLLIVDEAHNLKHGFHPKVSNRNRILGLALGHPEGEHPDCPWYGPRVKRVLCLSATPFEEDYGDLARQLSVLGIEHAKLRSGDGKATFRVSDLADRERDEDEKREIARAMLLRRVAHLRIAGEPHTKNMYRREWRLGGYGIHDEAMRLEDPRQRLVVGLIQKKVAEVLGDQRFGNQFQIGMLSSFESFLETVAGRKRRLAKLHEEETEDGDAEAVFDGDQTHIVEERRGADTNAIEAVATSYRERFGRGLPHPKLDSTAESLAACFETGEKALVFVRRVATVDELADKLDRAFDDWLEERMKGALPKLGPEVVRLFARFRDETSNKRLEASSEAEELNAVVREEHELLYDVDADEGGTEDFFSWFFRGEGPKGVLSGAAFQKNRLSSMSAAYSTLFEDDYVARLLDRPTDPLRRLAEVLGCSAASVADELRGLAWAHYRRRTRQAEGYPRFYVFESYQAAALYLLDQAGGVAAEEAGIVLHERFPEFGGEREDPRPGFPGPESSIGEPTFFTELTRRPRLREDLWPDDPGLPFREAFRRSEQRRELLSAMARLGASYVDLYLLAIERTGSFELRHTEDEADAESGTLARAFVNLLEQQRTSPGFHAYRELLGATEAFDTILAVNFPEAPTAPLSSLAETFGRGLQRQAPVGRVSGGVNKRLVRQFRMPGFPLILVSTDVLQEGEDLHTFCRNVIHYGITWTPSAMEQRTGRIDRIGSLVQRRLDGRETPALPEEKIQVHYPHLADTVEVLQVRRVLHRLDRFLKLIHERGAQPEENTTTIDKNREMLLALPPPPPPQGLLTSAFPVRDEWLTGVVGADTIHAIDRTGLERLFDTHWTHLLADLRVREPRRPDSNRREGVLLFLHGCLAPPDCDRDRDDLRHQLFQLELRSRALGGSTLIRCTSEVGLVDLSNPDTLDELYDLQRRLSFARVCARRDLRHKAHHITVESSLLFHPDTTQFEEIRELVHDVTLQADLLEEALLAKDAEVLHSLVEPDQ